jgi:hypothetical protein
MTGFDDEDIAAYYVYVFYVTASNASFILSLVFDGRAFSAHAVYSLCQG